MPFTINDLGDLMRLLRERPEWRDELRQLVLTEELLHLPDLVRDLAGIQSDMARIDRESHERLDRVQSEALKLLEGATTVGGQILRLHQEVAHRMARLEDGQARLQDAVTTLTEAMGRADEQLGRLEDAVTALLEAQRRTDERVDGVDRRLARVETHVGDLRGNDIERRYAERAAAYFRGLVRRPEALGPAEVEKLLDRAEHDGRVSVDEATDVLRADIVVRGELRDGSGPALLVVEVSAGVGTGDVQRAFARAAVLSKITRALPVVAGEWISPEAEQQAEDLGVAQVVSRPGARGTS